MAGSDLPVSSVIVGLIRPVSRQSTQERTLRIDEIAINHTADGPTVVRPRLVTGLNHRLEPECASAAPAAKARERIDRGEAWA